MFMRLFSGGIRVASGRFRPAVAGLRLARGRPQQDTTARAVASMRVLRSVKTRADPLSRDFSKNGSPNLANYPTRRMVSSSMLVKRAL